MLTDPWFWLSIVLWVLGGSSICAASKHNPGGWAAAIVICVWPFVAVFGILAGLFGRAVR